jgi:hypothetical protein
MNQISLPNGGFMKFASFGGKVVERQDGTCPECALFRTAGVVRPRCEHHFIERSAFGLKIADAPTKYAELLDSYKKASGLQRVAPMNPEFSFYRVMGLHGDAPNTNGDLFRWGSAKDPSEPELLRAMKDAVGKPVRLGGGERYVYQTFIGKGNYKDHNNSKVADAVGIILDAVPNHKVKGIELLLAVDRSKDPMLVRGIDSGYITDVSMGCRVAYSICSVCTNVAHNEMEYCAHVKNWKGQAYSGPETGWKNVIACEDNRGVEFIEESWVTVGADTKAKHLEKIAALRAVKGKARLAEILVEAEQELNKNSLCDWNKVNDLLDLGIGQAILA